MESITRSKRREASWSAPLSGAFLFRNAFDQNPKWRTAPHSKTLCDIPGRWMIGALVLFAVSLQYCFAAKLPWSQIPEAVKEEAKHFVNGQPTAETHLEKGDTIYHFSGGKNGKHNDVDLSSAGKFIRLEQRLGLGGCPNPVQNAFRQRINGAKVEEVKRFVDNDQTTFEVELTKNDRTSVIEVDKKGKLIREENEVDLTQAPAAVQATIKMELNAATLNYVGKVVESGDVSFHVEATGNNKDFEFEVADDGDLLRRELTLFEAPAAVQKTTLARMGNSMDITIVKDCENHDCQFTVENPAAKDEHSLVLAMNGTVVSESQAVTLAQTPAAVQKLVQEETAGAMVGSILKTQDGDTLYYEIEVTRDGNDESFEATPDGKILD